ncbi:MAG: M18 family aminopeptidase [Oscillospiraceae bacterium]|nr:M18 family aminopeptidase [Oscillospiraceae bacterium]
MNHNEKLFDFIAASPTPFHAVAEVSRQLQAAGYTALQEAAAWQLEAGKGYYVTRNGSSVIAFRMPQGDWSGFMMAAAHCDTPCLKVKENGERADGGYLRLATEPYGGMLYHTWTDRPLSVAGRVTVRTEQGLQVKLADLGEACCAIPNVAIHMNREANKGTELNPAVDLLPLYASDENKGSFNARVAACAGVAEADVLTTDLFVYNPQRGVQWGEYISAPRLDDLQCSYAALSGFLAAAPAASLPVCCIFDNEEVGSTTKQGAAGTFLADVLERICETLGLSASERRQKLAASFLASCDNGHAIHPAHGELRDPNHAVKMNGGVVVKYNANQKYTTDAVSAALFGIVCERAGVPLQRYANRADLPGGGTLGNIANTQVSLNTVDIGLAQLAMHSAWETAGAEDTAYMQKALAAMFSSAITTEADGNYCVK